MNAFETILEELKLEASAILRVAELLDKESVDTAFELLCHCRGKIVVTGIGKTGIIARKISATLASTGSGSIFVHAAEGIHGDLGMISPEDVVIAVSNSGNSTELLSIIPFLKYHKIPIIAITGSTSSALALASDVVLNAHVPAEYEALGLVPTSSTTVALAVGDALAVALLKHKNFQLQDFARFHPGGAIGKKLLLTVSDLMHTDKELPLVQSRAQMSEVIMEMTSKKLGCTAIVNTEGRLSGMITDGDLRRILQSKGAEIMHLTALDAMTKDPKTISADDLAVNAMNYMEESKITMLPVVNEDSVPIGMLHMHDLIRAGIL